MISLNERKIETMAEDGNKKATILTNLLKEPSQFLATIQIGITLAGFLASAFAAESFAGVMADKLLSMGINMSRKMLETISVIVITLLLSYITLVFGELIPKRLAMKKAESISMVAARPLKTIATIASPFVKLLTLSTNTVLRLFGVDPQDDDEQVTEEEIRMLLDDGQEHGTIQESEKWMIDNIFELDKKDVSDVMTHRTYIHAIPIHASLKKILELVTEKKHTRFPVYKDSIDQIIGILHVKDLIPYIGTEKHEKFEITNLLYPPYFVPESKRSDLMLKLMQQEKLYMAIVLDEYGGTAGIVTIKDLLEEIVGDLYDEYDGDEQDFIQMDKHTYIMPGLISLDKVQTFFDMKLPIYEHDTLSGFLIAQLGYIPEPDQHPIVEWEDYVYKVEESDSKRILKVKVSTSNPTHPQED